MTHSHRTRAPRVSPAGKTAAPLPLLGHALLVGMGLLASGCADSDDPVSQTRVPTVARFAPSSGDAAALPIPNDLLFAGSTDGTLNIPIADPTDTTDPFIALNSLDGWSTVAPANINFTRPIDPATVIPGDTVRMFEVTTFVDASTPVGGPVISADLELAPGVEFVAVANGSSVAVQPLRPLTPSTLGSNSVYMVILTNGIRDTAGFAVAKDREFVFASEETAFDPTTTPANLVQLQTLIGSQLAAYALTTGEDRDDVVASFTFTTQSVGSGLDTVLGIASGQEAAIIAGLCAQLGTCGGDTADSPFSPPLAVLNMDSPLLGTASELAGGPVGTAMIYVGILRAPYYLTEADNTTDQFDGLTNDSAPLSTPWSSRYEAPAGNGDKNLSRFNPLPFATSAQQMPMLVSVPDSNIVAMPPGGYPVVIFQHGIGSNRTAMLGVAEALANVGLAAVAIDLPLHGVTQITGQFAPTTVNPTGINIFSGYRQDTLMGPADLWERTFGMDVLDESGPAPVPGPDGVADSSGVHFINLQNVAVSRDNIRQAVSDLINLKAALGGLTIMGADVFDETEVHFVGHSLGGIVGTAFLATQPGMTAATLGMPGASIPYLLDGSTVFGPVIQGGLAGAGLVPGSPQYLQFLAAAQTIVDTVDPINHAAAIAANPNLPVYLVEIVGGGPQGGIADIVIPNSVMGAPFAGTEPLISVLGLQSVSGTVTDAGGIQGAVRFVEGSHSSLVTPGSSAGENDAFAEIQSQMAGFHATDGQMLTVTNGAVVQ